MGVDARGWPLMSDVGQLPAESIRIGELARRAGVPTATLRAWERRYGIVEPGRSEASYRLYSAADERRVLTMVRLIADGLAPAEAAQRALATDVAAVATNAVEASDASMLSSLRDGLLSSLMAFDEDEASRELDRASGALRLETFLGEVVLPVLREIGERWARGDITIGHEHFASVVIRGRLLGLARGWGGGDGPLALLACPGGEEHDLGVICFGLMLRARGWRIAFLGADTPAESIAAAIDGARPDLAVVFAMFSERFDGTEPALREIAASTTLVLAGPGSDEAFCERVGAAALGGDPLEAAAALVP